MENCKGYSLTTNELAATVGGSTGINYGATIDFGVEEKGKEKDKK